MTEKRPFDSLNEAVTLGGSAGETIAEQIQAQADARKAEQAKIKRTRIRQACERCKSRKTKCNNQRPCAACIAAGTQCYDWRPGMEPAASLPVSQDPLANIHLEAANDPVSLNDIEPFGTTVSRTIWPAVPALDRRDRPSFPYDTIVSNERGLPEHVSASGGIAHIVYLAKTREVLKDVIADGEEEKEVYWPIPPVIHEASPAAPQPVSQSAHDMVAGEIGNSWRIIFMLVRAFTETTHVLWPTYHLQPFLTSLATAKTHDDPVFICLLLSIAFVTLRGKRTRKDLSEETGIIFYHTYWKIRRAWPEQDWGSLTAIQSEYQGITFLAMGCMGGAGVHGMEEAKTLACEAVCKCLDLGLHRAHNAGFRTAAEVEAGRRTFWLVYCVDKMLAAGGRPALLRLADVDQGEITVDDPSLSERLALPPLLAYHRTAVRLYMVLERILAKINIPACSSSSAVHLIGRDGGTRRFRESSPHRPTCEADHRAVNFDVELQLLDRYQYSDIPLPSREIEEDEMYKAHLARIRSMSAFCRLLVASHLFSVDNSDIQTTGNLRHAVEVLRWSRELLASQRPVLLKGIFAATSVIQIAQVAKALLPVIHLAQVSAPSADLPPLDEPIASFQLALQLLHTLRPKFDAVVRHIQPLEDYAKRLGVPTTPIEQTGDTGNGNDANIDPELIEAAIAGLPFEAEQPVNQGAQTSGSGAIQALLSLSGQPGEDEKVAVLAAGEGQVGVHGDDGFEDWWEKVLNGTLGAGDFKSEG